MTTALNIIERRAVEKRYAERGGNWSLTQGQLSEEKKAGDRFWRERGKPNVLKEDFPKLLSLHSESPGERMLIFTCISFLPSMTRTNVCGRKELCVRVQHLLLPPLAPCIYDSLFTLLSLHSPTGLATSR